jgi:hypothetical protein
MEQIQKSVTGVSIRVIYFQKLDTLKNSYQYIKQFNIFFPCLNLNSDVISKLICFIDGYAQICMLIWHKWKF